MPFYFRKSVSAGPFRFNFSQHGVGASVGVKGLRIGTGPRGHYVHAGRGGFYYRATIGRPSAHARQAQPVPSQRYQQLDTSGMIPITSGSVMAMQDSAFTEILQDINAKNHQTRLSFLLGAVAALPTLAAIANFGAIILLPAILLISGAVAFGGWLDSYKRAVILFYNDEDVIAPAFGQLCAAFDGLAGCAGKWHVQSAKPVYDLTTWKRQAGASRLVNRKIASLGYQLPPVIKSNVTPPTLRAGRRLIYFLPDMALVEENGTFGAIGYDALTLKSQPSNFIETESVPRDTEVLYLTWEHPNKSGGPDRRFRSNRQIPVCRYELMHLTSQTGLNELFEFSRFGAVEPFISTIRSALRQAKPDLLLLPANPNEYVGSQADRERLLPKWGIISLWLIGLTSIALLVVGVSRIEPVPTTAPMVPIGKQAPKTMFVVANGLNCRAEPSAKTSVIKTLLRGETVTISEEKEGWSELDTGCWSKSTGLSTSKPLVSKPRSKKHRRAR